MATELPWRRILLKLSGEALTGNAGFGIDAEVTGRIADEIGDVVARGGQVGVVVGGGNFVRGSQIAASGLDRVSGDHMGMLATVMNALALSAALAVRDVPSRVLSALAVPAVCETFTQRAALASFEEGQVVLFAGGTGNPYFTTDTGAVLRAVEMGCDVVMKGTQVDGVYSADPKTDPSATRYDHLTHREVLANGLSVMDATAIALARDNRIPVIVFSIGEPGEFVAVASGGGRATLVTVDDAPAA